MIAFIIAVAFILDMLVFFVAVLFIHMHMTTYVVTFDVRLLSA